MRRVLIGVGNALRGDDGAGVAVARRVSDEACAFEVVICEHEPTRLLEAWAGADAALIVDAVSSGAQPGTVHRFDASEQPVPASVFRGSTHAFGVADVIELGRTLGRLPRRVHVFGIEGETFTAGERLSPAVAAAVKSLAAELVEEARCTSTR